MLGLLRTWLFCFAVALGALCALVAAAIDHVSDAPLSADVSESELPAPDFPDDGESDDVESDCDEPLISPPHATWSASLPRPRRTFARHHERVPASHFVDREPRPPSRA